MVICWAALNVTVEVKSSRASFIKIASRDWGAEDRVDLLWKIGPARVVSKGFVLGKNVRSSKVTSSGERDVLRSSVGRNVGGLVGKVLRGTF